MDVYAVQNMTAKSVRAHPIDDSKILTMELAARVLPSFFATCLRSDVTTGLDSIIAAAELRSYTYVVRVHLGIRTKPGGEKVASTILFDVRTDSDGHPIKQSVSPEEINEACVRPLERMNIRRSGKLLFTLVGGVHTNLKLVQVATDLVFEAVPDLPERTLVVSVAFFVVEDEVAGNGKRLSWTSNGGGGGGGGGGSFGGGGGAANEALEPVGDTARRSRLLGLVKAAWLERGYQPDEGLQIWHTQDIWKNKEAADKALADNKVTTFPAMWPHGRRPTTEPAVASSSSDPRLWAMQMMQMQQQTPVAQAAPVSKTLEERMETLNEWHRAGHITIDDYKTKKQKILDDL